MSGNIHLENVNLISNHTYLFNFPSTMFYKTISLIFILISNFLVICNALFSFPYLVFVADNNYTSRPE